MTTAQAPTQVDLVIVDDFLPTNVSAFRWVEYSHYMERYDFALLSREGWNNFRGPLSWADALAQSTIPEDQKWRVRKLADNDVRRAQLGYVTFLANAWAGLPWFRATGTPFVLQLYPGGGFRLDDPTSDEQLAIIRDSGLCRHVIATQTVTRDYLIDKLHWPPDQITFIWGGVFKPAKAFEFHRDKFFYPRDKDTVDICFVAHKYGTNLSAKGFDAFIEVAEQLCIRGPQHLRFHVVGGFAAADLPLSAELASRIKFYGRLTQSELADFYRHMDVIVSLNQPFSLVPGAFDGFPTGSCNEAGFQGVLNCLNDPLGLNQTLAPGRDILLVHRDVTEVVDALLPLLADPPSLYEFAERNCVAFWKVFDSDAQLAARTAVIDAELAKRVATSGGASGVG